MKNCIYIFLIFISLFNYSQDLQKIPELKRRVTDLTSTLMTWEVDTLEKMLYMFEQEKGSQIAVLIIPSTEPETIEEYSIRVAEEWKVGREGIDDGVILIVAINDRRLRIEVGYGLEGILPDATAKFIIDDFIVPHFRNGNYYLGIEEGLNAIIKTIKDEPLPVTTNYYEYQETYDTTNDVKINIFIILVIILGVSAPYIFGQLWGRISSLVLSILLGLIFFDGLWAFILGFVNLVMSIFAIPGLGSYSSRTYHSSGSSYESYSSSYDSSSSSYSSSSDSYSSGSDYSSFSGGGGSFGGGGASGSW